MKLTSENPDMVQILYDFDGEYHRINSSKRIRKIHNKLQFSDIQLKILNDGKGPEIDVDKYNDLQTLCKSLIIPKTHHQLFNLLPIRS